MKALPVIAVAVVLLTAGGYFGWMMYDFHESAKTDHWSRDFAPDADVKSSLSARGFPASIHRVVEVGRSSRFNGDGESLTIYCFDPEDVKEFEKVLQASKVWMAGLPKQPNWKLTLKETAPWDLLISAADRDEDFEHVVDSDGRLEWCLINRKKGVMYLYAIRR